MAELAGGVGVVNQHTWPPSDTADGLQLLCWGNSFPTATGNAIRSYWDRLRIRINPGILGNYAVGGRLAEDTCSFMFGTFTESRQAGQLDGINKSTGAGTASAAYTFYPDGAAILQVLENSAGWDGSPTNGGTSAKSQASFANALHAMIAAIRSASNVLPVQVTVASVTTTNASSAITGTGFTAAMEGRTITGTGIPAGNVFIRNVVAGVGATLSSTQTGAVATVNANASGTNTMTLSDLEVGVWTQQAATTSTAGIRRYTVATNGATRTAAFTSLGGRAWLVVCGIDSAFTGITGCAFTVAVDGVPIVTSPATTNDQSKWTNSGVTSSTGYGQLALDLGVLPAGLHTVTLTHGAAAGRLVWDSILIESAEPATVIIPKIAQRTATAYATAYPGSNASWPVDQIYNALVDAELAKWPADSSVIAWDPNAAGWDTSKHVGNTDGFAIHLNDVGAAFYANSLYRLLCNLPKRAGLIRL